MEILYILIPSVAIPLAIALLFFFICVCRNNQKSSRPPAPRQPKPVRGQNVEMSMLTTAYKPKVERRGASRDRVNDFCQPGANEPLGRRQRGGASPRGLRARETCPPGRCWDPSGLRNVPLSPRLRSSLLPRPLPCLPRLFVLLSPSIPPTSGPLFSSFIASSSLLLSSLSLWNISHHPRQRRTGIQLCLTPHTRRSSVYFILIILGLNGVMMCVCEALIASQLVEDVQCL